MANMSAEKAKIPELAPEVRSRNFEEVSRGYDPETAMEEASRCLNCKNPTCVAGCPMNVEIPAFVARVASGDFEGACEVISRSNSLPAICGRVCPQESQCEQRCVRGVKGEPVAIGHLERFVADWQRENVPRTQPEIDANGMKVAVVGSGPAGLACASDLRKAGYQVSIFEALHTAGGVLMYGIPHFRLPKEIVQQEVQNVLDMGVELHLNTVVGKTLPVEELFEMGFRAVFLATGAGLPVFMNIPGESLIGVYSANEYLTRINLMKAHLGEYDTPLRRGRSVAVIGGGNVAMDAARCAKRLGAEHVYVVYRRTNADMPARAEEVRHAKEEGVEFIFLSAPVEILADGNNAVAGLKCVRRKPSGTKTGIYEPDGEFVLDADTIIMSLGTTPNPLICATTAGLQADEKGRLIVNEDTLETVIPDVFAGGDAVTGAATVILAMGAGRKAARAIDHKLRHAVDNGNE